MRLIDADKLECDTSFDVIDKDYIAVSKRQIDDAPTIDAVPVVRCGDCIHRDMDGRCKMQGNIYRFNDDGFCCWGRVEV